MRLSLLASALLQGNGNGSSVPDGSVSLVLLAGGVGKRMGVSRVEERLL